MKRIALVAAAVLACAIVPSQAFSEDDYKWWNPGPPNKPGPGNPNGTISYGYSNGTISYGFSNSTNDKRDGDDHEKHPKCIPNHHGKGKHKGERECDGSDKGRGHAWGHSTNMTGNSSMPSAFHAPITPEKNRQNLGELLRQISSSQHGPLTHGTGQVHKGPHH